jgi:Uma2 family endonuclease
MATDTIDRPMTADEYVERAESAPSDVTWELIEGQLRERPMTTRGPRHSEAIIRLGQALANWLDAHPGIEGKVVGGEARCRIVTDPDTIVGIDVAYFRGSEHVELADDARFYDGPPVLAVEVLSLTDEHGDINQRIRQFLAAGVVQVWIANPEFQTITVHRPDAEPVMFAAGQEIDGGADLPGFRARVATLFTGARRST